MFKRLQDKWGVSTHQFWVIFIAFGLTGTTTAILARYITNWLGMDASTYWVWKVAFRIGMLLFGYQFILLAYGALLGQWAFFWKYEKKLLKKLGVWSLKSGESQKSKVKSQNGESLTKNIAIFASGAGSNAEKIIIHLKNHTSIEVALVVCNKPGAGVLAIAAANQIPVLLIEKDVFFKGDAYVSLLKEKSIDFIVLAGFLWKIPDLLIAAYPKKIINIHPALLPKYGGKGMYGMHVHEAVLAAGEKESGITIHYVNEHFDEGESVFQTSCKIDENETPETLAQKIHILEHAHFSAIVEKLVLLS
jgi:formyltetrahydrofolate-dependent phosphoribosylglycinamide formyltransferase